MTYAMIRVKRVWHYRFQINGVRVQKSTRETFRKKADVVAQQAYEAAIYANRNEEPVPTLSQLITRWLDIHYPVSSQHHLKSIETFKKYHLYELGDLPISAITTELVEQTRNVHLKDHKPASVNHWLRILKLVCMWAVNRGIIPKLPWHITMLKLQKKPRTILPIKLARQWLEAIDVETESNPGIGTAIRLMLGIGLRSTEAAGARWEWIDWERKVYTPGITKGREADPIPMPDWLIDHLKPLRKTTGLIAPKPSGEQYAPGYASKAMVAANKEIGISGLTPHRLRGTFATLLSEAGVPVQTIQRVLRHKSSITTMSYLEINLETASAAQQKIAEKMQLSGAKMANDTA